MRSLQVMCELWVLSSSIRFALVASALSSAATRLNNHCNHIYSWMSISARKEEDARAEKDMTAESQRGPGGSGVGGAAGEGDAGREEGHEGDRGAGEAG